MTLSLSRRSFLTRSALIGCSAAASPLLTPISFAAAPWDTRLVVIILRGGMDGLDVVRPYGASELADSLEGDNLIGLTITSLVHHAVRSFSQIGVGLFNLLVAVAVKKG